MADQRFEKGVGILSGIGEFFVKEECIDCDLCRQIAPNVFKRKLTGSGGRSCVDRQPETELDHAKAVEAMESCPVSAIQRAEGRI